MIKKALSWLGARLTERTSILGVVAVLSSVGVTLGSEIIELIITWGLAIGGTILFILKDKEVE